MQLQDLAKERAPVTDVTIRGIDDEVYARFAAEAKRRGVPIGELTTKAMKDLVDKATGPLYRIVDQEMLSVSKSDLESMDGPVVLENIEMLEFEDDVDWSTFSQHVERVEDVEIVVLPKSLSKFQFLTKAKDIELIKSRAK
jgi:hypothetical protein